MPAAKKNIAGLLPRKCLLGVVHLPALPGAPNYGGRLDPIRQSMRRDLLALKKGGAHAVIIENFGDAPFAADSAGPAGVACLTSLACEARELFPGPLGINLLRNDGVGAMAVAAASGADFIRVNVLVGARLADQGILNGIAEKLLRFRKRIGAGHIRIFADVDVKHSAPMAPPTPLRTRPGTPGNAAAPMPSSSAAPALATARIPTISAAPTPPPPALPC